MLVAFAGLNHPIAFLDGSERLLDHLGTIIHEWPWQVAEDGASHARVTVCREDGLYRIDAPWLDEPIHEASELRAVGNLVVDLIESYLVDHPSLLCLHCGAAEINGRLVVFPACSRAGKSTLMARLAAGGMPVFTDDVLAIHGASDDRGWSFGIASRLRLPLPESASERFRAFVDTHAILIDEAYAYLAPSPRIRPAFGRTAPLGAIVLLDRRSSGDATLTRASGGDGLQELIKQNLAGGLATPELVERTHTLIQRLPCFRLCYADLEEAAELIDRTFADWDDLPTEPAIPVGAALTPSAEPWSTAARHDLYYQRSPSVLLHRIDGELFLVQPETEAVYRLNTIASGLWRLLDEPVSLDEATEVLQEAFPDMAPSRIADDVARLFSELLDRKLVNHQ